MAKENVVSLSDVSRDGVKRNVKLDLNNGYVYDDAGNQLERWGVTEQKYSKLLADFAANECIDRLAGAVESSVRHDGIPKQHDVDRAKAIRMNGWGDNGGRLVKMDLGISDVHQASPMPNYAAGYRPEKPMADMYAAPLLTDKPSAKYYTFDKDDAFERALPIIGAPAGTVPEIAPRVANETFTTVQRAIAGFVATELEAAADAPLRIRQATMLRVVNAMLIERELRVATLATTSGNWDSSVYTSLAGGAKWNGGASSDPVKDLQDKLESSLLEPTGIILNRRAYHAFQRNSQVQKFIASKTSAAPMPNAMQISALLDLPPIYVAKMRYKKADGSYDYIWPNSAVLVRQPSQMPPQSQDDVASAITFRWNGVTVADGQASNGMIVREYFVQDRGPNGGNKVVLVTQDAEVQTSGFVGGLIAGVWA